MKNPYLIFASYTDGEGVHHDRLFSTWDAVYSAMFYTEGDEFVTDFFPRGKTYADKKEHVRAIACAVSSANLDASWGEMDDIYERLEFLARRYGLLREFRGNGVI